MATTPIPQTNDLDAVDIAEQDNPIATTPPPSSTEQNNTAATTPPPTATNWDDIDPVTGLSKEYMTAMDIIDSCDYAELRRFNALLLANQRLSIGQQIEMYYDGGESEEHRRKRNGGVMARRKSVMEKVAAIVACWRGAKSKKAARGGREHERHFGGGQSRSNQRGADGSMKGLL